MVTLAFPAMALSPPDASRAARNYRTRHEREILTEFMQLLAIPNLASDAMNIEKNANALVTMFARRGGDVRLLRLEGAPALVYAFLPAPDAKTTIALYAHYDGQPGDPAQWTTPPWQPVLRSPAGERIGLLLMSIPSRGSMRAQLNELILMPALNLRGIAAGAVGERASNAIQTEAHASIDFRLVPAQTPEKVRERVERHIVSRNFFMVRETPDIAVRMAHPNVVKLVWGPGYPPARTSMDLPISRRAANVITEATGVSPYLLPSLGGSAPMYLFQRGSTPVVGLPIVNHDNNQHAANENVRIQNLWDGIEIFAALFTNDER